MAREIKAHITGMVWKITVSPGSQLQPGEPVAILESMKMEMPVECEDGGKVVKILVQEGQPIKEGDTICIVED
jgi:acetyl-CoA carboxylase biotin carboxyl carrier protein